MYLLNNLFPGGSCASQKKAPIQKAQATAATDKPAGTPTGLTNFSSTATFQWRSGCHG